MNNFSKKLTLDEATELYKSKGMEYVDTPHNRDMMKQVVDNHLKQLRDATNYSLGFERLLKLSKKQRYALNVMFIHLPVTRIARAQKFFLHIMSEEKFNSILTGK